MQLINQLNMVSDSHLGVLDALLLLLIFATPINPSLISAHSLPFSWNSKSLYHFLYFLLFFRPIWPPKQLTHALFSFHFQSHLAAQNNSFSGWLEEKKRLLLSEGVYTFVYHFLIYFFYFLIN